MGISIYNIKRWGKMITGNSIYHVEQGLGKAIDKGGYYNDLTLKVLMGDNNLDKNGIPFLEHVDGSRIQMPTMIFQYGLGAYDLYLMEGKSEFLDKAMKCAEWAAGHQQRNGSWNTFFYIYPDAPYSAMPQGEGASLLLRLFRTTGDKKYLLSAKKAVDYMLMDVSNGGVTQRIEDKMYFLEYTHLPLVLNGWIFSIWGLYDLSCIMPEYKEFFDKTVATLVSSLVEFDNGYWSLYDKEGKISSPFYHSLHIAQLKAMYEITKEEPFGRYAKIFEMYNSKRLNKGKAFFVKAIQKIRE